MQIGIRNQSLRVISQLRWRGSQLFQWFQPSVSVDLNNESKKREPKDEIRDSA